MRQSAGARRGSTAHWAGACSTASRHLARQHARQQPQNIHTHYDLGNAFCRLWLDPSMNYSRPFEAARRRPERCQHAKVARALQVGRAAARPAPARDRLRLGGAGGEGLCRFGAQVTGVTLSTEQLAFARERLASQGQSERADLRLGLPRHRRRAL